MVFNKINKLGLGIIILLLLPMVQANIINSTDADGLIGYEEQDSATALFRTFDITRDFSAVGSTIPTGVNSTDDIAWAVTKANHERDQIILGTEDKGNDVNIQIYQDNNTWGHLLEVSSDVPNSALRAFDIAIEDVSGDTLLVYENSSVSNSDVNYRIWNGSAYSSESILTTTLASGAANWISLKSRPGSNDIMLLVHNDLDDLYAVPWNGTGFDTDKQLLASIGTKSSTTQHFSFGWEKNSGEGLISYGVGNDFVYRTYSPTAPHWSTEATIDIGNGQVGLGTSRFCSDPNSNNIGMIWKGTSDEVEVRMWDGSSILTSPPSSDANTESGGANNIGIDCTWVNSTTAYFGFVDANSLSMDYLTFTTTNTWSTTDLTSTFNTGDFAADDIAGLRFVKHPTTEEFMVVTQDINEDVTVLRWDGSSFVSPTTSTIEDLTEVASGDQESAMFDWFRYDPNPDVTSLSFNQTTYSTITGDIFDFNVTVSDNLVISDVLINITLPNGSSVDPINLTDSNSDGVYVGTYKPSDLGGDYIFNVIANDTSSHNNINDSEKTTLDVVGNKAPYDPIVFLNFTNLNQNFTNETMQAQFNVSDPNPEDDLFVNISFLNNTLDNDYVLNFEINSINYTPNTLIDFTIQPDNYTKNSFIVFQVQTCDDQGLCSNFVNSSSLKVENYPVTISDSLNNWSNINEDSAEFSIDWSNNYTDEDDKEGAEDFINWTYELNDTSIFNISINNDTNIVTVTPLANTSGSVELNFTVYDDDGANDNETVIWTINAVNDDPWNNDLTDITMNEDNGTTVIYTNLELNNTFRDVENDQTPTTYNITQNSTSVTTCDFDGDNNIECISVANQSGTEIITIEMNDSGNLNTTFTFAITLDQVNDQPWWNLISDFSKDEEASLFSINLTNNITDVEDDVTTLEVSFAANNSNVIMALDNTTNEFNITASSNATGSANITLTLVDSGGLTAIESFDFILNPINDQPWFDEIGNSTANNIAKNNGSQDINLNASFYFRDVENDQSPSNITISTNSSDVDCNMDTENTFNIFCNPTNDFLNDFIITLNGSDEGGLSIVESFEGFVIESNNPPECILGDVNKTLSEDNSLEIDFNMSLGTDSGSTINCTDVDADTLTYTLDVNPSNLFEISNENLSIQGKSNQTGEQVAKVRVSDGTAVIFIDLNATFNAVNDQPWWDLIPNGTTTITEDTNDQNVTVGYQTYFRDVEDDQNPILTIIDDNSTDVTCAMNSNDIECSPSNNFTGPFILTINGTDSGDLSEITSFEIDVTAVNDAPTANGTLGNATQNEDFGTFDNIITVQDFNANFSDVEDSNSPDSITLIAQTNTSSSCYLDISNNLDCFSTANQSGTDLYTFELNDTGSLALRLNWQIELSAINDAPSTPFLNEPFNNSNFTLITESNWTNSTDVEGDSIFYVFQLDNSSDFTNPLDYSNGSITETDNTTEEVSVNISEGNYYWRVLSTDNSDNSSFSEARYVTYDATGPIITLDSPENFYNQSNNASFIFNFTATDTHSNLNTCELWGNWTGSFILNETITDPTEGTTTNSSNITIQTGVHSWNVNCNDTLGNSAFSTTNYTLTIDLEEPTITLDAPDDELNTTSKNIDFNFTATDDLDDSLSCDLRLNNIIESSTSASNGTLTNVQLTSISDNKYEWNVSCDDNVANTNFSLSRTLRIDTLHPNFISLTSDPTSADDLDPGVNVTVIANVTDDVVGVETVLLQYRNSTGEYTNLTMSPDSGNLFNITFNATDSDTYFLRVEANDTLGNLNVSSEINFTSELDKTWVRTPANLGVTSAETTENKTIGTLTINNTGDFSLDFNVTADYDETYFNDSTNFEISSGELYHLVVNASSSIPGTFPITLTINSSNGGSPSTRTSEATLVLASGQPILVSTILNPTEESIIVTRGDENIEFKADLNNTGEGNATNLTFFFEIPDEWTVTFGNENVSLSELDANDSHQNTIEVTIPTNSTTGTFTVIANSTGFNESGTDLGNLDLLLGNSVEVIVNAPSSELGAATPTGGSASAGSSSTASSASTTGGVVTKAGTGETLFTTEKISILRGREEDTPITVANLFENAVMRNIKLSIEGFLSQYITIKPNDEFYRSLDLRLNKIGEERIFKVSGLKNHKIVLNELDIGTISITISSDPVTLNLDVGETKQIDLDGDKELDTEITLIEITDSKPLLHFQELNPTKFNNQLNFGEKIDYILTVFAPAYLTKEDYNVTLKITSDVVALDPNLAGFETKQITEYRTLLIEVREISRDELEEILLIALKDIQEMEKAKFPTTKVRELLTQAKREIDAENLELANQLLIEIAEAKKNAFAANNLIQEIKSKIKEVKALRLSVDETENILALAITAFNREDFSTSLERAKDAQLTYIIETKGKINFILFIKTYWWAIILAFITSLIVLNLLYRRLSVKIISQRIENLTKEEDSIQKLIRETQIKTFKKKIMSTTDYHKTMHDFEKRLNKIRTIRTKLRNKKTKLIQTKEELKNLDKEHNEVIELIKQAQIKYFKDKTISKSEYSIEEKSDRARLTEIEETKDLLKNKLNKKSSKILRIFSKITDLLESLITKKPKEKWIKYKLDKTTASLILLEKFDLKHIFEKKESKIEQKEKPKKLSRKELQIYFPQTAKELVDNENKKVENKETNQNIKNSMEKMFDE